MKLTLVFLTALLLATTIEAQHAGSTDNDTESTVGKTRAGQPVRRAWTAPQANPKLEACGFSKVQNVRIASVYRPQKAAEQYNHCSKLICKRVIH
jgi:hypothetical protein